MFLKILFKLAEIINTQLPTKELIFFYKMRADETNVEFKWLNK